MLFESQNQIEHFRFVGCQFTEKFRHFSNFFLKVFELLFRSFFCYRLFCRCLFYSHCYALSSCIGSPQQTSSPPPISFTTTTLPQISQRKTCPSFETFTIVKTSMYAR